MVCNVSITLLDNYEIINIQVNCLECKLSKLQNNADILTSVSHPI